MTGSFSDLHYKEVIDVHSGFRLGYIYDAEFDEESGQLKCFLTPGRAKFFGLLGYEDDYILPWENIVRIGKDIVLVETHEKPLRRKPRRKGFM